VEEFVLAEEFALAELVFRGLGVGLEVALDAAVGVRVVEFVGVGFGLFHWFF
jgi:hypothetical protein